MLEIRKTKVEDLKQVDEIFDYAKNFMHNNGNPTQWNGTYPSSNDVKEDIKNGCSYVVTNNDKVVATFACIIGEDKTYKKIYDGAWLNDDKYCVIHRIASNGEVKHVFEEVIKYVDTFNLDIRIDTHKDNKPMLKVLSNNGFTRCGIIYIEDGTKRIAFQKLCKKS